MPFWLVKFSVSPDSKPEPIDTVAPVRLPPLSGSLTVNVPSSVTGEPPPSNVTVPPAVTVGATCTVSSVLVAVLLVPFDGRAVGHGPVDGARGVGCRPRSDRRSPG